ncbi:hypothetical protein [Leptospira licerasiae]|uniref:Uncharacterized protein n=1 Tax=Leptospira licerasiae str. MMD4847 TaxID=1049971 RepID=A0ABN0HEC5_9LEPT|nr:hypothetical protein [Leptospira licerasiae]EIE01018.1 hypothetical protein LEP1GSC185_3864 [Leptospira licerasiae serovar Varillal str. VAR 010]EJZ43961.1 hypothetical protein LEP1GSC178_2027 [Leptospira licerasiae str. MMD4847]
MKVKIEPQTFTVSRDGANIQLNLIIADTPVLEILNSGKKIAEIKKANLKETFAIHGKTSDFKLTVWFRFPNISFFYFADLYGIGIELDDYPLKGTIADPDKSILKGLYALSFVTCIFLIKSVTTIRWYYYEDSRSFLTSILYSFDYIAPFLMLSFGAVAIVLNKYERSAFIIGIIWALLEFLDYSVSLKSAFEKGVSFSWLTTVIWITMRSNSMYMLWNGLQSSIKKRRLTIGASATFVDR